jgi:hypothetical protein
MDIFNRSKAKYHRSIERKCIRAVKTKQFNLTMSEDIVLGVKFLAAVLEVPRYVIAEHLLQVGSYHVMKAIRDSGKRQELVEHLVKVHLLGDELEDNEDILRLGQ